MRLASVATVLLLVGLAGCLGGEDGADPGADGAPQMVQVDDPESLFNGSWYDASRFSLDDLSQPVFDILPVEEVWVEVSDGTRVHNGVYRPDTTELTPVFINFSPYHGDTAETRGDAFAQYMIDHFVPRGYTVVLSSIRGTGHSEGCFEVASDRESQDLSEVVDFFAEQDWSNGKVAAGGKSYDSTTQNGAIAKFPTKNLRGLFHVSGITDMYEYTYHNGLPARADAAAFSSRYGIGQGLHEYGLGLGAPAGAGTYEDESPESLMRLQGQACQEQAENVAYPGATMAAGSRTEYWQERDWASIVADTDWDGSIFFYHGFHDWNVQPSHILPWLENLPPQIDTKVWLHQDRENLGHLYPMRADWNLTMVRWLDTELKGMDTGFWDEPRVELQGSDGLWRQEEEWPLGAPEKEVHLGETVMLDMPVGVPGPTSQEVPQEVEAHMLRDADDGVVRYSGAPSITATVTPMNEDPVFSAVLYDVADDGAVSWRNEATLRVVYRNGLDAPEPVTPGTPIDITVRFYPQDDVLEEGHRWVIALQQTPRQTVVTDAQLAGLDVDASNAVVHMDILDAEDGTVEHQPVPTTCFAC